MPVVARREGKLTIRGEEDKNEKKNG